MNTNQEEATEERRPFYLRLQSLLLHSFWTPEPDEKRFLAGLPITLVLILLLWKQGLGDPLGGFSVPASFTLWCAAYMIRFRERLKSRGELKRVIVVPAIFVALLLSVKLY